MEDENMSQNLNLRFRRQIVFTSEPSQSFVHRQHMKFKPHHILQIIENKLKKELL